MEGVSVGVEEGAAFPRRVPEHRNRTSGGGTHHIWYGVVGIDDVIEARSKGRAWEHTDDGSGDDEAPDALLFQCTLQHADGASDGRLDDCLVKVIAWDGKRAGEMNHIVHAFDSLIESAWHRDVRDGDEREVGEVWLDALRGSNFVDAALAAN